MNTPSLSSSMKSLTIGLLGIGVVVGLVGFIGIGVVSYSYRNISNVNLPNIKACNRFLSEVRFARLNANQLIAKGANPEVIEVALKGIEKADANFQAVRKEYLETPFSNAEEETLFGALDTASKAYFEVVHKMVALQNKKPVDGSEDEKELVRLGLEEQHKLGDAFRITFEKLEDYYNKDVEVNKSIASWSEKISLLITSMILLAACWVGYNYSRRYAESLVSRLTGVSTSLSEASSLVSSASTEIASTSQELSSSSSQQASSLAETAASIEEMNSMVAKNNENSKNAAQVSGEAESTAVRGQRGVDSMIASMAEIAASNQQVADIVKVIREIGDKTKVINDIVFQTKLLSFNASVEAARAGEHGKGFAVVAEEVGNLAQMSGNAAKEITDLLDSSINKVEVIVQQTRTKVEAGNVSAKECGDILQEIVAGVSKVTIMAGDISNASAEQATGVGEITKAMNQLDQVTQQNAASSEESANAASQLSEQAESLTALVAELLQVVNGSELAVAAKVSASTQAPVRTAVPAAAATPKTETGKVLQFKKKSKATAKAHLAPPAKKAANDESAPGFDDKRFEDF